MQAKSAKDARPEDKPSGKARGTKESLPKPLGDSSQSINGEGQIPQAKRKPSSLPLLLPEEILAAEPVVHVPKSPFASSKFATSQKRKFLDLEPKPPKDIKRGNVNVRVLQDNQSILPPKSSQASKALIESWLTGRGLQRRNPSGGFVRKV